MGTGFGGAGLRSGIDRPRALVVLVAAVVLFVLTASLASGEAPPGSVPPGTVVVTPGSTPGSTPGTGPLGPPRITLDHAIGLVDGQRVTASVAGIASGGMRLLQCGPGTLSEACDPSSQVVIGIDGNGEARFVTVVSATLQTPAGRVDCRALPPGQTCRLVAMLFSDGTADGPEAPIVFDPVAPLSPPTLTVTPAVGLRDGQAVAVRGTGFAPDRDTAVVVCAAGARTIAACDTGTGLLQSARVASDGTFQAEVTVPSVARTEAYDERDCRTSACDIAVYAPRAGYEILGAPIAFRPDTGPTPLLPLTVTPSSGLVDRQVVTIDAHGLPANSSFGIYECASACRFVGYSSADASGAVHISGAVLAAFTATDSSAVATSADCRVERCRLVLVGSGPGAAAAVAPLGFAPDAPLAPRPTLTIDPPADLRDGQVVTLKGEHYFFSRRWQDRPPTDGSGVSVATCVGDRPADCTNWASGQIAADGTLSARYQVGAIVTIDGRPVDCRTAVPRCRLVVGERSDPLLSASVELALDPTGPLLPPPELTVTPAGPVHDGDSVHVRVTNIRAQEYVSISQCRDAAGPPACGSSTSAYAAPDGVLETDFVVDANLHVGAATDIDCAAAPGRCGIVVRVGGQSGRTTELRSPLTFAANPDARRYRDRVFTSVDVTPGLVYGRAEGEDGTMQDLRLDVYEPHGDTATDRPVVVYAHGGYFSFGDRGEGDAVGRELARRGYVVVSIQYRLYTQGGLSDIARLARAIPAAQHDMQAAVRWVRAQAGARGWSSEAIGAMGYSAGAVTSLNLAYRSFDPGDSGNPGYPSDIQAAVSLSGAALEVHPAAPPVLLIHGETDDTVPYASAVKTCAETMVLGNRCTLVSYPGLGHGIYSRYADWMPKVVTFLADELIGAVAPPPDPPPTTVPPTAVPPPTVPPTTASPTTVPVAPGPGALDDPEAAVLGASVARPAVATPAFTG